MQYSCIMWSFLAIFSDTHTKALDDGKWTKRYSLNFLCNEQIEKYQIASEVCIIIAINQG